MGYQRSYEGAARTDQNTAPKTNFVYGIYFFVGTFHDFYLACGTAIISKKNWYVILCQHGDVLGHHVISMEVFYERCGKT